MIYLLFNCVDGGERFRGVVRGGTWVGYKGTAPSELSFDSIYPSSSPTPFPFLNQGTLKTTSVLIEDRERGREREREREDSNGGLS